MESIIKSFKRICMQQQGLIKNIKRNQKANEDVFGSKPQEVKTDWHPSMTQAEIFNELVDKMRSSK